MDLQSSNENSKVKYINGWMYDPKDFPPNQCIYVVAYQISDIERLLTKEELSRYKYFLFIHSTHFFKDFDMPKFDILFLPGWQKDSNSRTTDFEMVNWAIKTNSKLIGYKGENGDLLDVASSQKEVKFHGLIDDENPIDSIQFHPEVLKNNPEYLKWE